ncbi:cellulase family glycosylhydrolase [Rhodopirellula sp. P2]|uniref:cellulase family glycosylhydrolase n=1 Tax=Rhodopirellula sp. P2 TaxID=2127060 RepID=UPI0023675002|nr:cellulase family glycosylhydrolase [Rhodopirellula sp. P2]WDQ14734.1 cellulase family glycosylhydrolase [Rhodopirellula sp. P2]
MLRACFAFVLIPFSMLVSQAAEPLPAIRVSPDGQSFIQAGSDQPFVVWGVNYDHDQSGRLLDEYWIEEWDRVAEDFGEIQQLGANCVRIHLQLGLWMESPEQVSQSQVDQLKRLIELAESKRLYLDLTGLACYHKANIPGWLNELNEAERWKVQARFWSSVAKTCAGSPAIFCYDLMNEPILPGESPETDWLAGELGGKFFVQRLALDRKGRSREEIAEAWVNQMVDAIREHDSETMVTVGVIPWVFVFGGGKPLFYSPVIGKRLDFTSVHFYPEKGKIDHALKSLQAYEVGKPLVVEEMFPMKCGIDELTTFVLQSETHVDGWISFYWGGTAKELREKEDAGIAEAITAKWLDAFQELSAEIRVAPNR